MTNINWNEKPDWADVWIDDKTRPKNSGWHTDMDTVFEDIDGRQYLKHQMDENEVISYPPIKEWDGEGLPPVGTEVEIRTTTVKWHSVRYLICGYTPHRSYVFICDVTNDHPEIYYLNNIEFRPIKSAKEKWVDRVMDIYLANTSVSVPDSMGDIYDAIQSGKLPTIKVTK